jgi:hypothetical protein
MTTFMRKPPHIESLIVVAALCSLVAFVPLAHADGPSARIPARTVEFLPVLDGDLVQRTFSVSNDGSTPLVIERIEAG